MKLWFREKKKYLCLTKGDKDMQSTVFNNAQMELLDMMSFVDTPEMLAVWGHANPTGKAGQMEDAGTMENAEHMEDAGPT